jgi:hypothetical protein
MAFTLEDEAQSGAPAGATGATGATANGASGEPASTGPTRRGRGRPRSVPLEEKPIGPDGKPASGGAKPRRKKIQPVDVLKLSKQIEGMHWMAAQMTGLQELQLHEKEALMLAESMASVSQEYGISMMSGKTAATLQLLGVAAMIYAPRIAAVNAKVKRARAKAPIDAEVVQPNDSQSTG